MTFTNPLQRCTLLICHKNLPRLRLLLLKMKSWKQSNSETVASAVHYSAIGHHGGKHMDMHTLFFFFYPMRSVEKLFFGGEGRRGGCCCFASLCFAFYMRDCSYSVRPWRTSSIHPNPPPTTSAQTICHSLFLWRNRDGAMCLQHVSPPHHYHMCHGVSWASVTHMSPSH